MYVRRANTFHQLSSVALSIQTWTYQCIESKAAKRKIKTKNSLCSYSNLIPMDNRFGVTWLVHRAIGKAGNCYWKPVCFLTFFNKIPKANREKRKLSRLQSQICNLLFFKDHCANRYCIQRDPLWTLFFNSIVQCRILIWSYILQHCFYKTI